MDVRFHHHGNLLLEDSRENIPAKCGGIWTCNHQRERLRWRLISIERFDRKIVSESEAKTDNGWQVRKKAGQWIIDQRQRLTVTIGQRLAMSDGFYRWKTNIQKVRDRERQGESMRDSDRQKERKSMRERQRERVRKRALTEFDPWRSMWCLIL